MRCSTMAPRRRATWRRVRRAPAGRQPAPPAGWDEGGEPTRVDVTFTATGDGSTEVHLVHTGWEAWGGGAEQGRAGYGEGWPLVLSGYVAAVGGSAGVEVS